MVALPPLPTKIEFLSRSTIFCGSPINEAASYTLPAGGCNYLRWATTALCCTGWDYTLRASGLTHFPPLLSSAVAVMNTPA